MTEFERCLRYGRKNKKMAQGDVAKAAGLGREDIINLESGKFVPLDENTLGRIASAVGMDNGMLLSMYRSEFRQELKAARTLLSEEEKTNSDAPPSDPETVAPDLADIGKQIMAMPQESRDTLVATIRMLVRAQAISLAST